MTVTVNQQDIYIDAVWSMPRRAKRLMLIRTPARSVGVRHILDAQPFLRPSTFPINTIIDCDLHPFPCKFRPRGQGRLNMNIFVLLLTIPQIAWRKHMEYKDGRD
jgi:hypothetical protein